MQMRGPGLSKILSGPLEHALDALPQSGPLHDDAGDLMRYSKADVYIRNLGVGALVIGVTAVGIRGNNNDRIGVGFEDLSRPQAAHLIETLRYEFGDDVETYETGPIEVQRSNQAHNPVVPGCAVSAIKNSFGTLGAVVQGPHLGYGLISNAHVLDQSQGGVVWQPRLNQPGSRPIGGTFQVVAPAKNQVNTFDGAVARLDPNVAHDPTPLGAAQRFGAPVNQVATGTPVVKSGASSSLTHGVLDQFGTRVTVWYGRTKMTFARQYQILAPTANVFSAHGDSGSLIATQAGWHPFALLFAGNRQYSWGSPLQAALVSFGVSLV